MISLMLGVSISIYSPIDAPTDKAKLGLKRKEILFAGSETLAENMGWTKDAPHISLLYRNQNHFDAIEPRVSKVEVLRMNAILDELVQEDKSTQKKVTFDPTVQTRMIEKAKPLQLKKRRSERIRSRTLSNSKKSKV